MAYQFRPPLWSVAGTLVLGAVFVSAGLWQAGKGVAKSALEASFAGGAEGAVVQLDAHSLPPDVLAAPRAQAAGAYDSSRQLLLDNQTRGQVPGYRVWTPLHLADGAWLMVDRGWVAADPDRRHLPDLAVTEVAREVHGHWRPLPEPGMRLGPNSCAPGIFPRVLSYPTAAELGCLLAAPVVAGLLLLDPAETEGYVREWELPNPLPPARHYAYAAQWFAFAATLLFFFFKLNLKRTP